MDKFPVLGKEGLNDRQRALWDELTTGPRGFYTGGEEAKRLPELYNAWLQFPEFGEIMLRLGDHIRGTSELNGRLREIVVLTTSALLGAQVEFDFHIPFARNEGISDAIIDAINEGRTPDFDDPTDAAIYEANLQLLRTARLTPDQRQRVVDAIGYPGLMQMIATVMLYAVTAWTTNVARVELAEDFSADPDQLKDFFAGKSAS